MKRFFEVLLILFVGLVFEQSITYAIAEKAKDRNFEAIWGDLIREKSRIELLGGKIQEEVLFTKQMSKEQVADMQLEFQTGFHEHNAATMEALQCRAKLQGSYCEEAESNLARATENFDKVEKRLKEAAEKKQEVKN